jgi:Ca2+-transporting ATPase
MMESYLNENFGEVKPKHSSEEVLQRWRNLCSVVKNPKRRFRFTANLSKRYEAAAMRRTNQVSRFSFFSFFIYFTENIYFN